MHIVGEIVKHLWWGAIALWAGIRIENGFIQIARAVAYHGQVVKPAVPVHPQKSSEIVSTET